MNICSHFHFKRSGYAYPKKTNLKVYAGSTRLDKTEVPQNQEADNTINCQHNYDPNTRLFNQIFAHSKNKYKTR
jgi:hypothetical protein